jgi:hypothetical protein
MPIVWHHKDRLAIGQVFTTQGFGTLMAILKRYAGKKLKKSQFPASTAKVGLRKSSIIISYRLST